MNKKYNFLSLNKIMIKTRLLKIYTILLSISLSGDVFAELDQKSPNVLFIAIDDLNDWIGCFGGNSQVKTPNLDKFNA